MKEYIEKEQKETTNKLSNWVGLVFDDDSKGIILYFGDNRYHIITNDVYANGRNGTCGGLEDDGDSIKDTIDKWRNDIDSGTKITTIFCFDSYRELMTWFYCLVTG